MIFRKKDSIPEIEKRIKVALKEMKFADKFDYVLINKENQISNAVNAVKKIIFG